MKKITRRTFLKSTAAAGGMALGGGAAQAGTAPGRLRYGGPAAERLQADYLNAKIDWRQVDGERIKVRFGLQLLMPLAIRLRVSGVELSTR